MHWTDARRNRRRPKDLIARALDVEAVAIREPEIDELGILRHMIPPEVRGRSRRPSLSKRQSSSVINSQPAVSTAARQSATCDKAHPRSPAVARREPGATCRSPFGVPRRVPKRVEVVAVPDAAPSIASKRVQRKPVRLADASYLREPVAAPCEIDAVALVEEIAVCSAAFGGSALALSALAFCSSRCTQLRRHVRRHHYDQKCPKRSMAAVKYSGKIPSGTRLVRT